MKKSKSSKASKKSAKQAKPKSAKPKKVAKKTSKQTKAASKAKPKKVIKKAVKPKQKATKTKKPVVAKVVKKAVKKIIKTVIKKTSKLIKAVKSKTIKSVNLKKEKPIESIIHQKVSTGMKEMPKKKVSEKPSSQMPERSRYKDTELQEFKKIIIHKLEDAKKELTNLNAAILNANEHGTDDTASTFKMLEDGSDTLAKEEAGQLAMRQRKFIDQLENALVRIENKTYGVCRVTGKLIPKERLRAVPHTTQSMEAKMKQYND
ncbi:MAG: TraR/DksA C4-type zinc finger protein [Bacteroidia bacterium]